MNEDQIVEAIAELRTSTAVQTEALSAIRDSLERIEGSLVTKEAHAGLERRVVRLETVVGRVAWLICAAFIVALLGVVIPNASALGL